jgi:hypothetical protein
VLIVRLSAYQNAGGYDSRFFKGGEEETLSFKMVNSGRQLR